jgi:hypothetical protein
MELRGSGEGLPRKINLRILEVSVVSETRDKLPRHEQSVA